MPKLPGRDERPRAKVSLFRISGKWYMDEEWRIPTEAEVLAGGGNRGDAVGPYCMRYSPDYKGTQWLTLVHTQEPWGYAHIIHDLPPF